MVLCWHLPRKMQGTCISVFTHLLGIDVGYCVQYIVLSTFPFFTSISYKIHCQVHICICTLICPYVVAIYHKWLHIQLTCVMRVFLAEAITALAISISSLVSSTGLLRSEFSLISCVEENGNTLRKKNNNPVFKSVMGRLMEVPINKIQCHKSLRVWKKRPIHVEYVN